MMWRIRDEEADATDDGFMLYANELYTGEVVEALDNGQLISLSTYTDGIEDAPWLEWFRDGSKRVEGCYSNGYIVGTWREWHSNGVLAKESVYDDDHQRVYRKNGIATEMN